jgi:hypothetical protein
MVAIELRKEPPPFLIGRTIRLWTLAGLRESRPDRRADVRAFRIE